MSEPVKSWEKTLDLLAKAGYSYGYAKFVDLETGQAFVLVDAVRGNGPRVAVAKPTMAEAVRELAILLAMDSSLD